MGRCSAPRYDATFDVLTRREYAIAALAANGLSNKEIGRVGRAASVHVLSYGDLSGGRTALKGGRHAV